MFKFILASSNEHKAAELQRVLGEDLLKIDPAPQKLQVVEDGKTYYENAFKKAQTYYDHYQVPVVADDSGLEVEALPGELGIHSARFGGEHLSDDAKVDLLLERLANNPNRQAYYSCVLCFYFRPEEVYFFQGRLDGQIGTQKKGTHGFGYDPIFMPHELAPDTLAMHEAWKLQNSHRTRAALAALAFLRERIAKS
ncbi:MAG: non-canonical purine NTP pyrophosphatase [Bacteriovoracaceae bacterium]|nr:non-canonical purine NTP pyrophosphatase [Bacteriovoracaceae bacterium]